jgi:hypothetical protein
MRLYVANCTMQLMRLQYRLDFDPTGQVINRHIAPKFVDIGSGKQMSVGGDLELPAVQELISQLNPYGMLGEVDVLAGRQDKFCSMVFQLDRPVSAEAIRRTAAKNKEIRLAEGEERRRRMAIAANETIDAQVRASAPEGMLGNLNLTPAEVGLEQLVQSEAGERTINEAFTIVQDPSMAPPPGTRRAA